jgi:hypothetical protein
MTDVGIVEAMRRRDQAAAAGMPAPRRNFAIHLGILCLLVGLLLSQTVLEAALFPPGTIGISQVAHSKRAAVILACQIGIWGLGVYLLAIRPRITMVHLAALALAGCGTVLVATALLQVLYRVPPVVSGWGAFAPPSERNEFGFRGRPIVYSPGDYVVLLLGDSQVEAMALSFDTMPERILEKHLDIPGRRVRVFSVAAGAYGNDQELLALQRYFERYRADLVVLWETPANDIWNNMFNIHMASRNPKPTFWLDRSGALRGPAETFGQPLANSPIVLVSLLQRAFGLPWRERRWERRLPEAYRPLHHYDGPVNREWQERWDTNRGKMRDEELETEMSGLALLFAPRSKRMQYGLDLTHALLHRVQTLVAKNGGGLSILIADTEPNAPDREEVYVLNGRYYRASRRQARENLDYVNKGLSVDIVPVTVSDWRVSADDGHLNRNATEQVISELANRLRSRIGKQPAFAGMQ